MKHTATHAKNLTSLLKKIGEVAPPDLPDADDTLAVLVQSFLMWESTTEKAAVAYGRLRNAIVDFNDLRVCMPHEVAEMLGPRYPRAEERCERLRAALRDIYLREHLVSLASLAGQGKRDVKKYIETLHGIAPYMSARVQLLCFDVHGLPVDEQLRERLTEYGAAGADTDTQDVASWLSRQIRATEGLQAHFALQAWVDGAVTVASGPGGRSQRSASGGGSKKTSTKRSGRKSAGDEKKASARA